MRLLLANANTTDAVTERVVREAIRCARPGTEISGVTARFGAGIVSTEAENTIAAHAALDLLATHHPGHDAAILAISFDSGLEAARQVLPIPVIGMTEAALHTACLLGRCFGLITFGTVSRSLYLDLVERCGLSRRLAAIESIDIESAAAYLEPAAMDTRVEDAATRLVKHEAVEVVVICGAATAGMAHRLQPRMPMPLIDGIACAVGQAELLVGLRPARKTRQRPLGAGDPIQGVGAALERLIREERP